MSASQSASRLVPEKPDRKSTLDSGLKMKIMRSKSIDGCPDQKLKIVKNESNGSQTTSQSTNSGTPVISSSKSKQRDNKKSQQQSVSSLQQPSAQDSTMVRDPSIIAHPIGFTAKNIPVSNLFAAQSTKYTSSNNSNSSSGPSQNIQSSNNENFHSVRTQSENATVGSSKSPKNCGSSIENQQESNEFRSEEPPNKRRKAVDTMVDRCVGTSFGTLTEPECLGPCEPGTSVNLDGIVWHETEDGILVVNATWRGRSYVGTLLDSTRHDWAPPRPNDGNEDWDCRTRAGRAKRRNATYGPDTNSPLTPKTRSSHNKTRATKESVVLDLFSGNSAKFASPRSDIRKSREDISSNDEATQQNQTQSLVNPVTGLQVEIPNTVRQVVRPCPVSPVLLECPEQSCNKKYKNAHGLRYHQSHEHGADCFDDDSVNSVDLQYVVRSQTPSPTGEPQDQMPRVSVNGELGDVNKEIASESSSNITSQCEEKDADIEEKEGMVNGAFSSLKDSVKSGCDMENPFKIDEKSAGITKDAVNYSYNEKPCTDSPAKSINKGQISVKTDIFEQQLTKETSLIDNTQSDIEMKDNPLKLPTIITNFSSSSRENTRSPAYSDISDDSLSMSSSDFIDKLIKSTEVKPLQQSTNDTAYQQHQTENQTTNPLYPEQLAFKAADNDQNPLPNSLFPATTVPGQCNMSSSAFINPYNLLSSSYQIVSDVKNEDHKNEEKPSILHSKKDEETGTTLVIKEEVSSRTEVQGPSSHSNQEEGNGCAITNKTIKIEKVSPPDIKPPKEEPRDNHQGNKSSHHNPKSSHSKQSKKSEQRGHSASKPQSNEKISSNPSPSRPPSTTPNPQLTPKSEPNSSRPQCASNMKPPLPPMSRPPGPPPPLYYPQNQYMSPTYSFNASYQQYQNSHGQSSPYNLPYYSNQMPRYSMPMDQKNNIRPAPYMSTSSPYGSNITNYSAQSSAGGYTSLQTSSAPTTSAPINPNTQQRFPSTSNNGRSTQTHFHTHHHTHVGLNSYPVYSASYEGGMVSNQQSTSNLLSPYSPPPAK